MSELLQALAFVFRRKGADRMSTLDFKHCLSLDLRWFAPADAKRLVDHALELGLLEESEDEHVSAAFDPSAVEVPVTFKPTLQVLQEAAPEHVPPPKAADDAEEAPAEAPAEAAEATDAPEPPVGPAILLEAADASGEPLERLIREAEEERARRGRLLTAQVAAILVARRRGVDVTPHLQEARAALRPE